MSTKPQSYASLPQAAHILVEVVYGLITRDCRGMGICKLNAATSTLQTTSPCGSSYAVACITADSSFSLRFLKSSVSETQFQQRFASGIFQRIYIATSNFLLSILKQIVVPCTKKRAVVSNWTFR